jgi:hypothetical protein
METVVVQVNNKHAFKFFKNMEELNLIKMLRHVPDSQVDAVIKNNGSANRDR